MTTSRLGFLTCGLSLVTLAVSPAAAQTTSGEPDRPQVRTAATVQRTVPPDLATVTLEFAADGATPSEAGARLAARADSLRRALGTLGIPRDSLVNRSRWYWWRGRIEVVPGPVRYVQRAAPAPDGRRQDMFQDTTYRAHDAIEVRIHDLKKVGAVLDTALGRRITDISGVQFKASDVSAAQEDALREATVRARRQAEAIADAGGQRLGRVLSLSTQGDDNRWSSDIYLDGISIRDGSAGAGDGGAPTVVVHPMVTFSVTVYGRWELVAKP